MGFEGILKVWLFFVCIIGFCFLLIRENFLGKLFFRFFLFREVGSGWGVVFWVWVVFSVGRLGRGGVLSKG